MDKKEEVKISIIVPVYNLETQLPRCVESIMKQTYHNIEIILVDDGSKDNSRVVIEKLAKADPRIVPIYKENGGVTSARIAGCRIATGDYIGFVDGDDEIELDMYEVLMNNAIFYQADISHCGYKIIYDNGKVGYFYNTGRLIEQDRLKGLQDLLEGLFVEPGLWNKLFNKKLFNSLLIDDFMDNSIKINEDLLMNFYLFSKSQKSIFFDVCKYHYFAKAGCGMNKNRIYDPIKVRQTILNACDKELKQDAEKALVNTCVYTYCSLTMEKNSFDDEKMDIRKIIIEHYSCAKLLPKKTKILTFIIKTMPNLLEVLYPLYSQYVQKKKYE